MSILSKPKLKSRISATKKIFLLSQNNKKANSFCSLKNNQLHPKRMNSASNNRNNKANNYYNLKIKKNQMKK